MRISSLIRLILPLLIALAALSCGSQPAQKVVVLGIDGLTFDLLIPWAKEGKLPHFQKLLEEGSSTQLISSVPPSSPPAWTSAITGVNPGKHGIFGFVKEGRLTDGKLNLDFYTSRDRQADPLWVILTERGRRSVVVNVPCSSPPDQMRGVMISGFPHTSPTNFTSPPEYRFKIPRYRKDIYGQLVGNLGLAGTEGAVGFYYALGLNPAAEQIVQGLGAGGYLSHCLPFLQDLGGGLKAHVHPFPGC